MAKTLEYFLFLLAAISGKNSKIDFFQNEPNFKIQVIVLLLFKSIIIFQVHSKINN